MKETVEFRIPEEDAAQYVPAGGGMVLGETVRKVKVILGMLMRSATWSTTPARRDFSRR